MTRRFRVTLLVTCLIAGVALAPREAAALVRLENICTVQGQKEVRLTGLGLVVGLNGTGDGGRNLPTIRALGAALRLMNSPVQKAEELRNADNVAVVLVEATVPKTGLRRGQRIDCYVSSIYGAKSLKGGRLLTTPLTTENLASDIVAGLAAGAISIEEATVPTNGRIPQGTVIETDVAATLLDAQQAGKVTLLLDAEHASFHSAHRVATAINEDFKKQNLPYIAQAKGPEIIEVEIPRQYRDSLVEFIAELLDVAIDNPHTEARVVLNAKTGTVVVSGEVELSSVVVSHKNLTLEIGNPADIENPKFVPAGEGRFVPLVDPSGRQSSQQLQQLVNSLNQLRVPTSEIIAILRELHASGKLHAVLIER